MKIDLKPHELLDDEVYEKTNSIRNYIKRDIIEITKENIIQNYEAAPLGIPNLVELEENMEKKGLFMTLNKNNG